ncbi:putative F-box only protein [Operophtera brumata]|uniref:Putative F-box only protein n=1 Tax=Operophtera brumata TaxID=104452 RepID=A0A0L7LV44_OPEBR|nr:putative F-box only protein [Operophtera brumata]
MDIHSNYVDAASSTYENVSFGKAEDSGYHTSTPSSLECDDLSNQYFNPSIITTNITISSITRQKQLDFNHKTPEQNFILYQPYSHSTAYNVNLTDTPIIRRGVKRPYSNEEKIETPTSFISGKIKSLDVNKENSNPISPVHSIYFDAIDRTLNILFRSEHKVDVISKLLEEQYLPPIENIFNYLSNKDIHNFCLVSKNWNSTWNLVSHYNKRKQTYLESLKTAKENLENREKGLTPIKNVVKPKRHLKEIHNELNDNSVILPGRSPPGSPRTNRFKKFTKSASLDSRAQAPCVRCNGPAKVTAETSGEVWAECKSGTCSYQFCKDCSCDRHPGKCCSQYDLSCPSPSKRKKSDCGVGTKKSRRNLRRL